MTAWLSHCFLPCCNLLVAELCAVCGPLLRTTAAMCLMAFNTACICLDMSYIHVLACCFVHGRSQVAGARAAGEVC